jgi:hypothetical protein
MKRKGAPPAWRMPSPLQRPRSSDAAAWPNAEAPLDPDPREAAALAATVAIYKSTRVTKKLSPLQAWRPQTDPPLRRCAGLRTLPPGSSGPLHDRRNRRRAHAARAAHRHGEASQGQNRIPGNAPPPNRRGPRRHLGRPHLPLGDASRGSEETWPSAPCGARLPIGGIHQRKDRASYGKLWVLEEVRDVENTFSRRPCQKLFCAS